MPTFVGARAGPHAEHRQSCARSRARSRPAASRGPSTARTSSMTSGVFSRAPAYRLPTTTTGRPIRHDLSRPLRYRPPCTHGRGIQPGEGQQGTGERAAPHPGARQRQFDLRSGDHCHRSSSPGGGGVRALSDEADARKLASRAAPFTLTNRLVRRLRVGVNHHHRLVQACAACISACATDWGRSSATRSGP